MKKFNSGNALKAAGLAVVLGMASTGVSASEGEELFNQNCSVCHAGGGNSLNPTKTLSMEHLQANGYTDAQSISGLIAEGKAPMPPFKSRLSAEQMQSIAEYVLEKANAGW